MANETQSLTYFNFVGGLNTEASPLNMEAKYAKSMSNIKLNVDGSIETRDAIDFLGESSVSGTLYKTEPIDGSIGATITLVPFSYVNPVSGKIEQYFVLREGPTLVIYQYEDYYSLRDLPDLDPVEVLDLSPFIHTGVDIQTSKIKIIVDSSVLFVIGEGITTCFIEKLNNRFRLEQLSLHRRELGNNAERDAYVEYEGNSFKAIRRSTGQSPDSLVNYLPDEYASWPLSLSSSGGPTKGEAYWELYQQSHKDTVNQNYDEEWDSTATYGTNITTLRLYYNTEAVSFTAGCVSNSRLWLAGLRQQPNVLYYSQTVESGKNYGRFYQFADPYNYLDSARVDTDGGSLIISGAGSILEVVPLGGGVVVLATQGVWYVGGGDLGGGFAATDFSVNKLSSDGAVSKYGYVLVESGIVYIAKSNINFIGTDDIAGTPKVQSMSVNIDSFYRGLPETSKLYTKCIYNSDEKKMYVLTNFQEYQWIDQFNPEHLPTRYKDILIFDFRLKAWYKYSLDEEALDVDGTGGYIADMITLPATFDSGTNYVFDNNLEPIVADSGEEVVSTSVAEKASSIKTMPILATDDGNTLYFALGTIEKTLATQDFQSDDSLATNFDCYLETAHQVFGELAHKKWTPYIYTAFRRVEDGTGDAEQDDRVGGCYLGVSRDFSFDAAYSKYDDGKDRQVYKPWKTTTGFFELTNPGTEVVLGKEKIRGRGTSFFIRLSKEPGKKFHLYGLHIQYYVGKGV